MSEANIIFKTGTRSSRLAVVQTGNALRKLEEQFPQCRFEEVLLSSPGDRDLVMDLRESSNDFFTRDLDDKVLSGELDCAVHSAKDVPDPPAEGLDWFWLPWKEDRRDAIILPAGKTMADLPDRPAIGVSSDRREAYSLRRFPSAELRSIRGNIEERLEQLDAGDFDIVIMAAAALVRLGLTERISEWIPLEDLPPPEAQGTLCLTFRDGDERFVRMRSLFVKAVTFAGAGVGSSGTCTLDAMKALRRCDICLHDALMGPDLIDLLPPSVECVHVGKRSGRHSLPQEEITALIGKHARKGQRVVRLKGGDPGVFGRLAEEVDFLDALHIPYRVLPGVSSLSAASTGTGMLLTRRGLSRGFCVMTPRLKGGGTSSVAGDVRAKLPMVFFMAVSVTDQIARELIEDGVSAETPAAMVFGAGGDQSYTVSGTLKNIGEKISATSHTLPGTLIIGEVAGYSYETKWGALQGKRTLITSSAALQDKAAGLVHDAGGRPVCRPLIKLVPDSKALERVRHLDKYDWVVLTSPSAVRCFHELLRQAATDIRSLPKLVTCGGGTSQVFKEMDLAVDIQPTENFGAEGLLKTVEPLVTDGTRVLRLRSDKAGSGLAETLRELGAEVDDCILYQNEPIAYDSEPAFDAVFFASASAVEVFDSHWGADSLTGKTVVAIGQPTLRALEKRGITADIVGPEATVESSIEALAEYCVKLSIVEMIK
ncbi:MAG: uroporphyrinogen-III C-methyltransferase [Kiritimatiellia bacterium]|jgi:uroporphyrinogen III methyltransferase/synthase|nr:uroporphyrinogen-III C-methyltransferase [Kiritimatiellia bacterium]MDP6847362.1 uroporphyrinogen-III C-methyltransferase [Kiritimatiellia bacterium]